MPMKKTIEIKKDEKGFGTLYVNDEPFLFLEVSFITRVPVIYSIWKSKYGPD